MSVRKDLLGRAGNGTPNHGVCLNENVGDERVIDVKAAADWEVGLLFVRDWKLSDQGTIGIKWR